MSFKVLLERILLRPLTMLVVEPILLLVTIYLSIVYGVLYALFEAYPIIFAVRRGIGLDHTGLMFISVGIGAVVGATVNMHFNRMWPKLMEEWRGYPPPEERLFGAMLAGPLLVIGAFWLGWTGEYTGIGWYVPALSGIPIGAGVALVFISFLVSSLPRDSFRRLPNGSRRAILLTLISCTPRPLLLQILLSVPPSEPHSPSLPYKCSMGCVASICPSQEKPLTLVERWA